MTPGSGLGVEDHVGQQVATFEERMRLQVGLIQAPAQHYRRPAEIPFTADQRASTTILLSGLTAAHDFILAAALQGLGYRVEPLPVPDNSALATGKEFCNRGQCNPTYYTVGNLVRHLRDLRARGIQEIEERYVFVTLGGCGPCRFGMYESEYRKALVEAGFGRFRVVILGSNSALEQRGMSNATPTMPGIAAGPALYLAGIRAVLCVDLLNALGHAIRSFECEPGATNHAMQRALEELAASFRARSSTWRALRRVRAIMDGVDLDLTRIRPRVKMVGEFWALTTEGDGSYHLLEWLEHEGAEVIAEPVSTWVEYMIETAVLYHQDRRRLIPRARRNILALRAIGLIFRGLTTAYRGALGFRTPPLTNQGRMMRAAADYYDPRLTGGEGHMEVAEHILSIVDKKAHMVVSVKPFGCMPSTQSDGVQTRIVSQFKESLFIPIETTGDGEVNVRSRLQMKLFEAKVRAREELQRALDEHGVTIEQVRAYAETHPRLCRPMLRLPQEYVGTAANFVALVAREMGQPRGTMAAT